MAFELLIIGALSLLSELKRKMSKRTEFLVLVLIFCSLACLTVSESCTVEGVRSLAVDDDCGSYKDLTDCLWDNSLIQSGIDELCQNSKLFSFPSTLNGLITEEHTSQAMNLDVNKDGVEVVLSGIGNRNSSSSEDFGLFELSNGRTVSCSLHSGEVINQEFSFSRENEGRFKNDEMKLPRPLDSSYLCVQISHYQLTWGQINLYHPSVTSLSIQNTCNEISIIVYEPFSTDSQFYPCNFTEVQLGPGESVSLCLVFLPTMLGLSSAHFIVQTSSGGYFVQAKGFGVESPYKIMPMTEFDVSSSGWRKSVSLFNPFDEAIELEEMVAWVSVFVGNSSHSAKAVCREEGVNTSSSHRPRFLNAKKWLDVRTRYGFPTMTLRPHSDWLIGPQGSGGIMDINFEPNFNGKILGTLCLHLRRTLLNKTETLLIPLEGEPTYNDNSDLVTASIEAAGINEATRSVVFSVSVTNSGFDLLKIVKITEVSEKGKFLKIEYSEGLLLFPGSVTQVAVIMVQPLSVEYDELCKICIFTNSSFTPQLEIPCQHLIQIFPRQSHLLNEIVSIDDTSLEQRRMSSSEVKIFSKAEADEYVLKIWRDQGARDEHKVVFPVIPVGSYLSKLITVKNPIPEPVVVQLIMSSREIVDNCRSIPDGISSFHVLHNLSDRPPIRHGFSIGDNTVTSASIHPYGSVELGPIFFRPYNACEWRSGVLVRNNISGGESLSLLGFGGSLSLLLFEGSQIIRKIEFDVHLPFPLNIAPPVLKELVLTNNGDLPIAVTGIYVSGTECQLDGFKVHNCKGFNLEPGESTNLVVSYQTDFTSSTVARDLELRLSSNNRLVVPLRAIGQPVWGLKRRFRKSIFSFWDKQGKITSFIAILFGGIYVFLYRGGAPDSTDNEEENVTPGINPDSASASVTVENSAEHVQSLTQVVEPSTSTTVNRTVQTGDGDEENTVHSQMEGKAVMVSEPDISTNSDEDVQPQTKNPTVQTGIDNEGKSKKKRRRKGRRRQSNQSGACTTTALDINLVSASESVTVENSDVHVQSPTQVVERATSATVNQTVQTGREQARKSDEENAIPIAKDAQESPCKDHSQREGKAVMVSELDSDEDEDVQSQTINPIVQTGRRRSNQIRASNTTTAPTPPALALTPSTVISLASHQGPQSASFNPGCSRGSLPYPVTQGRGVSSASGASTIIGHQQQAQAQPRNSDDVAGPSSSSGHPHAQSDNVGPSRRTYRDALVIRGQTEERSSSNMQGRSPIPIPRVRSSSTSTIACRLQAPGSNLCNQAQQAEDMPTYNMWGEHIFERMNRADNSNRDLITFHMGDPKTLVKNFESSSCHK